MAAYAALLSLNNIMDQIQVYHAHRPIFLDEEQRQLKSLKSKIVFLQEFLENYSGNGRNAAESLETRIAEASYDAEDIIEPHVMDDIEARYRKDNIEKRYMNHKEVKYLETQGIHAQRKISTLFSQKIQKIIENMDCIKKEAMKIKEKSFPKDKHVQVLEHVRSITPPSTKKDTMVGFDSYLNQIVDKLARNEKVLQVIPITGMGGIGKTTLARNVYDKSLIVQHFDIRGWATISQDYNAKEALVSILKRTGGDISEQEKHSLEYHQLGEKLHKHLKNRRYLIIIDDLWSVDAWDKLKLYLPDDNNSSRIIVTTRLSTVANSICSPDDIHHLGLLDENASWTLLCETVFGLESSCPPEFEEIGKDIAKKCKGLPLSIVVIGGILKSNMVLGYWENIVQHINSTINYEDNERCLKILALSYNHLPVHLKPCFLYMGVFPEDSDINIEELIRLWVAEGFLKPKESKIPEEVAMDYLKDLIERNLVLVGEYDEVRRDLISHCKIHDLLMDFCLSEAQKHRFLYVMRKVHNLDSSSSSSSQCIRSQRRCVIPENFICEVQLELSPFLRSLIVYSKEYPLKFHNYRLLRVMDAGTRDIDFWMLNARYLCQYSIIPRVLELMCFLQTLNVQECDEAPLRIWEMTQLRHVSLPSVSLSVPLDGQNESELENLQTLSTVYNFRCTEKVLGKILNIKELRITFEEPVEELSYYCLNNLHHLQKLHTLKIRPKKMGFKFPLKDVGISLSLKELYLSEFLVTGDDMVYKIGPLPNLESLMLCDCPTGEEWKMVEDQFLSLKYLSIDSSGPVRWIAESSHFPKLEFLELCEVKFKEIPRFVGEIETLREIHLTSRIKSVVASAKQIFEEHRSNEDDDFRLLINGIYTKEEEEETT